MKTKYFVLGLGIFILSGLGYSITFANPSFAIDRSALISRINSDRAAASLGALNENTDLDLAAQLKLDDMVANNYFAHNSPQGVSPWYFFHRANYNYQNAGENLAMNFIDPQKLESAWMASPLHRQNLLNKKFTEVGIASKETTFHGKRTTFIVAYFGSPQVYAKR